MRINRRTIGCLLGLALLAGCAGGAGDPAALRVAPVQADLGAATAELLPAMRWDHRPNGAAWTEAAFDALGGHGAPLLAFEPADIDRYCPGYGTADAWQRQAFWAGFLSGLAKHESTWRQEAVGGEDQWYGLLQISPATARGYGCAATSGTALLDGERNLSCAIRIMAETAPRDGVIATRDERWRGIAADWGPMRQEAKRADIAAWTRQQPYCAL